MARLRVLGTLVVVLTMLIPGYIPAQQSAEAAAGGEAITSGSGRLSPDSLGILAVRDTTSDQERAALLDRYLALRERVAARSFRPEAAPQIGVEAAGPETQVGRVSSEFHLVPPSALQFGRNFFVASPSNNTSTVPEPSAHQEGRNIFYTRNWNAQYSLNGGSTWTNVAIPAGPADAPSFCCDQVVIKDAGYGTIFWIALYINSNQTNGVLRIYVRRNVSATNCSYTIDPGGTANNVLPDYPQIALSKKYLYITTNNIVNGVSWGGAQVRRFSLPELAGCETTPFNVVTYTGSLGQRIIVPAEGAREVMFFTVGHDSSSVLRLGSWADNSLTFFTYTRAVSATNFANSDCRGGVGNFDWIEGTTSWYLYGFRHRSAVGKGAVAGTGGGSAANTSVLLVEWNAGRSSTGSPFPQAYIGGAVFREDTLALLANRQIWNSGLCFGYPAVTANKAGDFGITLFGGGKNGGGGTAQQGYVGIDDEFTTGTGVFSVVFLAASGDRNPSNARVGDYVTIHPHNPCQYAFSATSAAINGSTAPANRNTRYVEFFRARYRQCWLDWGNAVPRTQ